MRKLEWNIPVQALANIYISPQWASSYPASWGLVLCLFNVFLFVFLFVYALPIVLKKQTNAFHWFSSCSLLLMNERLNKINYMKETIRRAFKHIPTLSLYHPIPRIIFLPLSRYYCHQPILCKSQDRTQWLKPRVCFMLRQSLQQLQGPPQRGSQYEITQTSKLFLSWTLQPQPETSRVATSGKKRAEESCSDS